MASGDTWPALARALIGDAEFTAADLAAETGVDRADLRRLWQALGFPPVGEGDRVFTRSDVAVLRAVRNLVEQQGTETEALVQLTRVIGQSLARIAEAQVAASADRLAPLRNTGTGDQAAVEAAAARVTLLASNLEPLLGYVWRRHLIAALRRFAATVQDQSGMGGAVAVGFVDLVGFTAISQELAPAELAAMVDRLEAIAYDCVTRQSGRVIKMIGDEVMFAAETSLAAAEIGLAMVDACAADERLPDVRVGLAKGPALSWEGDLFGPTVNLASRLVNLARPGTVLVSTELGEEVQGSFTLRPMRPLRLQGIGRVRAYVLRRQTSPSTEEPSRQPRRRVRAGGPIS